MNPNKDAKSSRCSDGGAKQNFNGVISRRRKKIKCKHSQSTPSLVAKNREGAFVQTGGFDSMSGMTTAVLEQVLKTSRALADLVLPNTWGSSNTAEGSSASRSSTSLKGHSRSYEDLRLRSGRQFVEVSYHEGTSALRKLSASNSWLLPVLQQAWEQVCSWVISLGVVSAYVMNAAWRLWSEGINQVLNEIWDRETCGHMVGFEFMDLLQFCLIFLHNYLRDNEKQNKCVYKM